MTEAGQRDRDAVLDLLVALARREALADRLRSGGAGPERDDATDDATAPDPALTAVVHAATVVLEAAAASIALHDPRTDRLTFVVAAGPAAGDVVGLQLDPSSGIAGYAFSTGQPLAVADVEADPRFDRNVAVATGYVPRSLLATPLYDEAGTVGVLEVLDRRGGTFDLRDLEVAAALGATATAVIRQGQARGDVTGVLRAALASVLPADDPGSDLDIDAVVAAAVRQAMRDGADPTWLLADRLGRLVGTDPERSALAIDLVDALLRDDARRVGRGSR